MCLRKHMVEGVSLVASTAHHTREEESVTVTVKLGIVHDHIRYQFVRRDDEWGG